MPGVNQLLKQAQKMQAQMQNAQAELASKTFTSSVAGGAVQASVNGQGQVTGLKLDEGFVKESDAALVSSMILTAIKQAQEEAAKTTEQMMGALAGPLKGLMG